MCHHVVVASGPNRDALAGALPRTRGTATLRAAIREHRRQQRAAARGAPEDPDPLGFSVARMLAGERSADAGRVRPLADVVAELRREAVR